MLSQIIAISKALHEQANSILFIFQIDKIHRNSNKYLQVLIILVQNIKYLIFLFFPFMFCLQRALRLQLTLSSCDRQFSGSLVSCIGFPSFYPYAIIGRKQARTNKGSKFQQVFSLFLLMICPRLKINTLHKSNNSSISTFNFLFQFSIPFIRLKFLFLLRRIDQITIILVIKSLKQPPPQTRLFSQFIFISLFLQSLTKQHQRALLNDQLLLLLRYYTLTNLSRRPYNSLYYFHQAFTTLFLCLCMFSKMQAYPVLLIQISIFKHNQEINISCLGPRLYYQQDDETQKIQIMSYFNESKKNQEMLNSKCRLQQAQQSIAQILWIKI